MTQKEKALGIGEKAIKHQSEDADQIIMATDHEKIDPDTAVFLNRVVNLQLEYEDELRGVDMCKAMEKRDQRQRIEEAIEIYREYGESDESIINKIMTKFNVAREFVVALLTPQKV